MRKLIDSIVWEILVLAIKYLFKYYDIFIDEAELWLEEKLPSLGDLEDLEAIEDFERK